MTDIPPTGDRPVPESPSGEVPPAPMTPPAPEPVPGMGAESMLPTPMPSAPPPIPTAPPPTQSAWQPPPAAPPSTPEVPGAPGHYFAATVTRVAALLIDSLVLGFIAVVLGAVVGSFAPAQVQDLEAGGIATSTASMLAVTIATLGSLIVSYLYFALLWRSAGKATLGQRVFKMQVGNAFDGAALTWRQATIRWLTLFGLTLLSALPFLVGIGGLAAIIWDIALLVTTATSATKQGIHDRWAGSAVVATGPQNTTLAWGCLIAYIALAVLLLILVLIAFAAFFAVMSGAY